MAALRRRPLRTTTEWCQRLLEECRLESSAADALAVVGFAVIDGPVPPAALEALVSAYDRVVAAATGPDKSIGRTTTRLHDLVNRGSIFIPRSSRRRVRSSAVRSS